MILTATCASAFDSIIRRRVGLLDQRNYLKCLLFHHPKMSAFLLDAAQTVTAPSVTPRESVLRVQARPETAKFTGQGRPRAGTFM